ncbi:hypothetical protein PsAD5_02924 [Pseudovibrio sp. Ad5]|uniref:MerR family transcriptional regulator n=1 Tax=Pseudovibrio sp. Ad5 TaxID=989436 RepID=UPI0007AED1B2|nr:MerR family transcriptional regulator [Pseudovibrio sp. Ad5]KZK94866.1 hypothetical protein PsAD5_02924 [Pseudovibrio sp. Ad5]
MEPKTDLFSRTFTASEVAKLIGMNIETLRVWRRRKQFVLEGEREGWTRYTFGDLMVVATYNTLVRAHCTNAMAEMIAGTISIRVERNWPQILDVQEGVFCICNMSADDTNLSIQLYHGLDAVQNAIADFIHTAERQPAFHVVDCTALIVQMLGAYDKLQKEQTT